MEKTYVIAWKAKHREGTGMGKKLFNREEAESLASELNRDYPDFEHTVAQVAAVESSGTESAPETAELDSAAFEESPAKVQVAEVQKAG